MTAAAFADRLTLYDRLHMFPSATNAEHAAAIGRCRRWVAKWKARIGSPPHPDPLVACRSRSSARHHPPPSPTPHVFRTQLRPFGRFCASINAFTPRPAANANRSSRPRPGLNSNSILPIFPQSFLLPRANTSTRAKSSTGSMLARPDHWR